MQAATVVVETGCTMVRQPVCSHQIFFQTIHEKPQKSTLWCLKNSDVLSSILGLPGRSSSWAPPLAHVPGLITHGQLICLITWPLFKMVI